MTSYTIGENDLQRLKGKKILLTGCASGIGRATALEAHRYGAKLVLADWDEEGGMTLVKEIGQEDNAFVKIDVSNWNDIVNAFDAGVDRFGSLDAVISNAGINSGERLLEESIDPHTGKLNPPPLKSLEVNLISHLYVVRCAHYYFGKWPEKKCQIVLTASAASFLDTAPLYMYQTAKTGVLGLMRSLRSQLPKKNITINAVCPWMTVTPMLLKSILDIWGELPANQPTGVADALLLPIVQEHVNGKALFVAGHEIIDFEDTLLESQPMWMGRALSESVNEGQRRMAI